MHSTQHPNAVVITSESSSRGNRDTVEKGLECGEKNFGGSMGQITEKNRVVSENDAAEVSTPCCNVLIIVLTASQEDSTRKSLENTVEKDASDKASR